MIRPRRSSFLRAEDGAALMEFALLFPVFMLVLGLAAEGARTFWSCQTAVTGVRDATCFLSRVVDSDSCGPGKAPSVTKWHDKLTQIVRTDQGGNSVFPAAARITKVRATLGCRGGTVPIATVTATLQISYPVSGLFRLTGIEIDTVSTTVGDSARITGS